MASPPFPRVYKHLGASTNSPRRPSAKEQKQILADINAGSQKIGRKLLAKPPGHKRAKSSETITPVTVLSPEPEQEDRRGRKSTSSNRPKLPKRTNSMRRAYNYFFGGSQPAPPSPTSPVTAATAQSPKKDGEHEHEHENVSRDAGLDTPPKTPAQEEPPAVEAERAEGGEEAEEAQPEPPSKYHSQASPPKLSFSHCLHPCLICTSPTNTRNFPQRQNFLPRNPTTHRRSKSRSSGRSLKSLRLTSTRPSRPSSSRTRQ